jgi:hypothetical protein
MSLKSLDIFSVHGFPVGLIECQSNLIGITSKPGGAPVGSGGWALDDHLEDRVDATFADIQPEFLVLRTIIGVSPPEWAELAGENSAQAIPQNAARTLDMKFRKVNSLTGRRDWIETSRYQPQTIQRIKAMIDAAVINGWQRP